mmetsp:Transcript_19369/g.31572  ORF Transcript_19369/g.31572 Transcript_19369/m.31572 type:complete len:708 (+) Transcript_19369:224-2347(+)
MAERSTMDKGSGDTSASNGSTLKLPVHESSMADSENSGAKGSSFKTEDIARGGYLYKRARKSGINWRKRYFVFDEKSEVLSYYTNQDHANGAEDPLGSMQMGDSTSIIPVGMRENCLEIHTGSADCTPLYIQASDPKMLLLWKLHFHSYVHSCKSGYLEKRARKSGRNWRMRYFCLDLTTGLLRVYETEKMDHVPNVETLGPKFEAQRSGLRENCIEVRCKDGSTPSLFLVAKNVKDHLEWLTSFKNTCRSKIQLQYSSESPRGTYDGQNLVIEHKASSSRFSGQQRPVSASTAPLPQDSPSSTYSTHHQFTMNSSQVITQTTNNNNRQVSSSQLSSFDEQSSHLGANGEESGAAQQIIKENGPDAKKRGRRHRRRSTLSFQVDKEVIVLAKGRIKGLAKIVKKNSKNEFVVQMKDRTKLIEVKREDVFPHRAVDFEFTLGKRLGKGAFATVYAGMNRHNGALIAIKKMRLKFGRQNREVLETIMDEVQLLKELSHENIVKFLGTQFLIGEKGDKSMYIIMEQVSGGSLESALRSFGKFSENVIFSYTQQVLKGLAYLHSQHVVHRDLKCANVLLSTAGVVKLADFGVSKRLKDMNEKESKETVSCVGSPYWMAPEVVLYEGYDTSCDVWSLGCTIIEMATACHPWKEYDNPLTCAYQIGQSEKLPFYPDDLSAELKDLIQKCLKRNKSERPKCLELMLHPGFRKQY